MSEQEQIAQSESDATLKKMGTMVWAAFSSALIMAAAQAAVMVLPAAATWAAAMMPPWMQQWSAPILATAVAGITAWLRKQAADHHIDAVDAALASEPDTTSRFYKAP